MSKLKGIKILIIDDEELIREVLRDIFSMEGAEIIEAQDGKSGLEKLSKESFNVVVCDYRMPGLDGIGVSQQIQKISGPKPLIFLCTGQSEVQESDVTSHGVKGIFYKPFQSAALINTLVAALENKSGT